MVLVIAGTLDLDALAVEEKALVGIELDIAEAEGRDHPVEDRMVVRGAGFQQLVVGDHRLQLIELRVLKRP